MTITSKGDEMSDWQPIETAPKNPSGEAVGPFVLVFCGGDRVIRQARFVPREGQKPRWYEHSGNGIEAINPTHWMPLPAPPQLTPTQEGKGT